MKIAILGDLHFISPDDPATSKVERQFFENTEWHFEKQKQLIQDEKADLVISLGDLVDWYSDINRDYAIKFMDSIGIPWKMVAGNHDFQMYPDLALEKPIHTPADKNREFCTQKWLDKDIELHDRVIETDGAPLILLETAPSETLPNAQKWLKKTLEIGDDFALFTHVPLDTLETRKYIHEISPNRDLAKYVCAGSPWIYETIKEKVKHVFTGHLHFSGEVQVGETQMHLIPLGCYMTSRQENSMGQVTFFDTQTQIIRRSRL